MKDNIRGILEALRGIKKSIRLKDIKAEFSKELRRVKGSFSNFDIKNKKVINFITVLAASAIIFAFYGVNGSEIEKVNSLTRLSALNDGERYFYSGDYEKSIKEYEKLFRKDNNPLWYCKIAEVYSVQGNLEKSKEYIGLSKNELINFEKSSSQYHGFYDMKKEILNYIVFNEYINKDYQMALKDGEEYIDMDKDNKALIKTMIALYKVTGNMDKAENLLINYPVDDNSAYDKAEFARMLMLIDKWDQGFKELKEAWYLDKDEYKVYDVIAQISAYNRDDMVKRISKLIDEDKNEVAYKVWMAKIYSISADTAEESIELLDEIKDSDIGSIQVNFMKANIHKDEKDVEGNESLVKSIIDDNEDDYRVLHTAAWYYFNKGQYKVALDYCSKSIEKNKNYPDNYGFLMPEILKALNNPEGGKPYFRTAIYREPYNYNILLNIANFYWDAEKNSEKSLEYFNQASLIKPEDVEIKYNMAMININISNFQDAIDLLRICVETDESVPKYHRTLGTLYMVNGNTKEGIKETRAAYESDKNDVLNLNNAGCYYINFTDDLERGVYNLQKAYEGLNDTYDEYTKTTIKENYDKASKLLEQYLTGEEGESLKVPQLVLFY
ncbi:MAG: hypothetical protein MR639_11380 [Clostridium sp.]|uniref:tetratricopeptide repeat protein n=1 Tax=Clostridium sp. TaxID=1506 RepID=UPI002A8A2D46|nr:hypothetical protein [Clostridium sp.]MDY5097298.1 hypothetical protein [Clostridium sp.]